MYQVISVVDGIWHHEGFFALERQANSMKYWVEYHLHKKGIDGEVFVNVIKH